MNEDDARKQKPVSGFTRIDGVLSGLFPPGMTALAEAVAVEEELATKAKPTSRRARRPGARLAEAAAEIAARPDRAEIALTARELVQCNFPHRDPGKVPFWIRKNGDLSLVLQPGIDEQAGEVMGLPYGAIPRLILFWVITEANRTKSPRLKAGASLNAFVRAVGYDPSTGGGKRSDTKRIKEQMLRLFQCRISFKYSDGDARKGRKSFVNMELAAGAQFWWDFKNPDQNALFESEIILNPIFFEAITAAPVPMDFRALKALKHSSFALDVYAWATYRVYQLEQNKQREVTIPLASLKEQFGGDYTRLRDFKAALAEALAKVQEVYPALDYTLEKSALVLRAGRRALAPRDREERKALAQQQARQMAHEMSQTISHRGRAWFEKHQPGQSFETAAADFYHWRDDVRHIKSENTDAHFIDFVKEHWGKQA